MDEPPDRSYYKVFEFLVSTTVSIMLQHLKMRSLSCTSFADENVPSFYQLC